MQDISVKIDPCLSSYFITFIVAFLKTCDLITVGNYCVLLWLDSTNGMKNEAIWSQVCNLLATSIEQAAYAA
jgi:hypothetical protein